MTQLVLGPLLRYAGTESATFWVETSAPCEVEILGHRTHTFTVEEHHFALLLVDDLEPASVTPGVPAPSASWRFVRRPTYDNSVGELELAARSARVTIWRSPHHGEDVERLVPLHRTGLASAPQTTTTGWAGRKEGDPEHART
jgi:hypothetical protein